MREHRPRPPEARGRDAAEAGGREARADFVMERFGRLQDADRSFDIAYWQRQGDAAIFAAAWELAELYHLSQGMGPDELRLQRAIEAFQRS